MLDETIEASLKGNYKIYNVNSELKYSEIDISECWNSDFTLYILLGENIISGDQYLNETNKTSIDVIEMFETCQEPEKRFWNYKLHLWGDFVAVDAQVLLIRLITESITINNL